MPNLNANKGTKNTTNPSCSTMATAIRTAPDAASKQNERKRKHSGRVRNEGAHLESPHKKKKYHHRASENATSTLATEADAILSSDVDRRHKKKKKKQRAHAQAAGISPPGLASSTEGNGMAKLSKERKESKRPQSLENIIYLPPTPAVETCGTGMDKNSSPANAISPKQKCKAVDHDDNVNKWPAVSFKSPIPETDNAANPLSPPTAEPLPKTKKKSEKSKEQRVNEVDADSASASATSPPHTPTAISDSKHHSPLTPSTSKPTIEQLAKHDDPADLLQIISRSTKPKANPSQAVASHVTTRRGINVSTRLGNPARSSKFSFTRLDSNLIPVQSNDDDSILWTKWLSAGEVRKACEERGIEFKQGTFTQLEGERVARALEEYRVVNRLSNDSLAELIYAKRGQKTALREKFWRDITRAVTGRSLLAVYQYVRRRYNPLGNQGPWTEEEDNRLRNAVGELGGRWEEVSLRVGRHAGDCRDRYRNHIAHRGARLDGRWAKEEEELLTTIVQSLAADEGKDQPFEVPWTIVSERMGYRRSRQQCRIKWQDGLSKRVKQVHNEDVAKWGTLEQFCLVQELKDIQVNDDSEINWNELTSKARWNCWSSHDVKRRWQTLKKGIDGHKTMSYAEIVDVLKAKFSEPPADAEFLDGQWVAMKKHVNAGSGKAHRSKSVISDSSSESDFS